MVKSGHILPLIRYFPVEQIITHHFKLVLPYIKIEEDAG